MRRKLLSFLIVMVVGLVLGLALMGTTYTKSYTRVTVQNWGAYLTATHTFSGTVTAASSSVDTVLFPFTMSAFTNASGNLTDTVLAVFMLHTKPSAYNTNGDSTYVTWQFQFSTDNVNWTTAAQICIDSAVTTTTPSPSSASPFVTNRLFVLGKSVFGLGQGWPTPYGRIRAVGGNGAGIKNDPGNVIQVDWLK